MRRKLLALFIVIVFIVLIAVFFIYQYHVRPQLRETLEFGAAVAGGSAAVLGAIYGFILVLEAAAENRRRRSLDVIDQLNRRENVKARMALEEEVKRATDVYAHLTADSDRYAEVVFLLGMFEDIAMAIRVHAADELVLYESIQFIIPYYLDLLAPFIDAERKQFSPLLYEDAEGLAKCWQKGISFRTGKPLVRPADRESADSPAKEP